MELRRKTEIHEIEERKNQQINDLLRNHEKAFSDIKNYYNDITLNNLNLINTLKSEIEKKKQEEERLEKRVAELESENRKMREPLEAARKEMEELRRKADMYEKMKSLYEVKIFKFPILNHHPSIYI
jgi:chromosome segregation ATPase